MTVPFFWLLGIILLTFFSNSTSYLSSNLLVLPSKYIQNITISYYFHCYHCHFLRDYCKSFLTDLYAIAMPHFILFLTKWFKRSNQSPSSIILTFLLKLPSRSNIIQAYNDLQSPTWPELVSLPTWFLNIVPSIIALAIVASSVILGQACSTPSWETFHLLLAPLQELL